MLDIIKTDLNIMTYLSSLPFYKFCYGVSCNFTYKSTCMHAALRPLCFWILLLKGHFSKDFCMVSRLTLLLSYLDASRGLRTSEHN